MPTSREELDPNAVTGLRVNGYLHLPGMIPPSVVRAAKRAINVDLAAKGLDAHRYGEYESSSFCPSLRGDRAILDLVAEPGLWSTIEQLLGPGRVAAPSRTQIALRFPEPTGEHAGAVFPVPHVDGFPHPLNRIPAGTVKSYSILVACHLSDTLAADSGNFSVWPGTHLANGRQFAESGTENFDGGRSCTQGSWRQQIYARAGDVTLMHYLLGHHPVPNLSPEIRYTVFFRVSTTGLQERWREAIIDPWSEWSGMRSESVVA